LRPLARFLAQDTLLRVPVVGLVEVRLPGDTLPPVFMRNDGEDRIASMLYWRGLEGWEPATIRTFLRLISPGSTVIDVGANSGLFALLAARLHPTVRVHAVEPVRRVFSRLEANVALNGLGNVTCHRLACSDGCGPATLHVPTGEPVPVMASLVPGWCDGGSTEEAVECVTVDDLVASSDVGRCDVVKIDAEGSEDAVLRGAGRTLDEHHPFVLAEVLGRSGLGESVAAAVATRSYCFYRLGPQGPYPSSEVRGGTDDDENHNYLFVHPSRIEELYRRLGEVAPTPPVSRSRYVGERPPVKRRR
jgi:FkbM family methyltransferase